MAVQDVPNVEAVKDYVRSNVANWEAGFTYAVNDVVIDSGNLYKSLVASNIGILPSTDSDLSHWELIEREYADSTALALAIALG